MLRRVVLEVEESNILQQFAHDSKVDLRIMGCRYFGGSGTTMLIQLDGERPTLGKVTIQLRSMAEAEGTYWVDVRSTRFLCLAISNEPLLCSSSRKSGIICIHCPYNGAEGRLKWEVLVKTSKNLKTLLDMLRRSGVDATVRSEASIKQNELLTARQRQVVFAAIQAGFFDFPRKVGLTELSGELEIDPSTLSETLRNAERKIIRDSSHIST